MTALKGAAKAAEEMGCLNIAARHLANATQALFRAGNKSDAITFARSTASLFQQNNQAGSRHSTVVVLRLYAGPEGGR